MQKFMNKKTIIIAVVSFVVIAVAAFGITKWSMTKKEQAATVKTDTEPIKVETTNKLTSGLLVGLAKKDTSKSGVLEEKGDIYRTLWIYENGDKLSYIEKKDVIITPYKDKFIKLQNDNFEMKKDSEYQQKKTGNITSDYSNYYNFVNIVASEIKSKAQSLLDEESFNKRYIHKSSQEGILDAFKSRIEKLIFVGNNYVCINTINYSTGGGSMAGGGESIKWYTIDELSGLDREDKTTLIKDMIDSIGKDKISKIISEFKGKKESDLNGLMTIEEKIDNKVIVPKRVFGSWHIFMPVVTVSIHNGNGSYYEYATSEINSNVKVPQQVVTYDELNFKWEDIQKKVPNAKDAVCSPSKDLLGVITDKELLLYKYPQKGINEPSLSIPLDGKENMILNQWATGDSVAKWTSVLK